MTLINDIENDINNIIEKLNDCKEIYDVFNINDSYNILLINNIYIGLNNKIKKIYFYLINLMYVDIDSNSIRIIDNTLYHTCTCLGKYNYSTLIVMLRNVLRHFNNIKIIISD